MQIERKNPKSLQILAARVKDLDGKTAKAGWFKTSHYADGTPVAYIAAIQEFGVHINHPGGTPYRIVDGKAVFVSKANGAGLPITKAHPIVIPPRPFMRPTVLRETQNWLAYMASGAKAVVKGNITAHEVMDTLGARAAADIVVSITQVFTPPLKKSTIAARRRARSDKKTVGLLDKPLVDSGRMLEQVNHSVETEYGTG